MKFRKQILVCSSNQAKFLCKSQHTNAGHQHSNIKDQSSNEKVSSPLKLDKETQREVEHHGNEAKDWWDKNGSMKALHSLNAIR